MGDFIEDRESVDLDPIKASYDIFIKPSLVNGQKLYVLQFPTRKAEEPYSAAGNNAPTELRIKPKTGLVEIDVPIESECQQYDRVKGANWGDALKQSNTAKGGSTYGLPGGFGVGAQAGGSSRGRKKEAKEEESDDFGMSRDHWNKMVREGRVMKQQTLGGQTVPVEDASPTYMIGAFRKNQLHLTPVTQIVQLRPQFHHIDAEKDMEKQRSNAKRDPTAAAPGAARAIHMQAKVTPEGAESHVDTMVERITKAQQESWRKLEYNDENSAAAWEAFEKLFVATANPAEAEAGLVAEGANGATELKSSMSDADYLDAISAPRDEVKLRESKAKPKKKRSRKGKEKADEDDDDRSSGTLSDDEDVAMGGMDT